MKCKQLEYCSNAKMTSFQKMRRHIFFLEIMEKFL